MARRRMPKIHSVTVGGDLNLRFKGISFGKLRQLMALMDEDGKDAAIMETLTTYLAEYLITWDMLDENGKEMPINRESLDELDFDEVIEITNAWLESITGPDKELGKDSSSGETSLAASLTMEAI